MDDLFSFCLSCGAAAGLIVCRHTSFDELLVLMKSPVDLHIGKKSSLMNHVLKS